MHSAGRLAISTTGKFSPNLSSKILNFVFFKTWTSHEASSSISNPPSRHELWPTQENANFSTLQVRSSHQISINFNNFSIFRATSQDMCRFHDSDYIDFLQKTLPGQVSLQDHKQFNLGDDCPIFDGLFDFCSM